MERVISKALIVSAIAFVLCAHVAWGADVSLAPVVSANALFDLTNVDRVAAGVAPLSANALLNIAAQMKADDMATKGYYSHTTPEGYQPYHWFNAVGYIYLNVGENLHVIYSGDENTINNAWMGSPEHRSNILLPQFTEIGVAVARGSYRGLPATFAVQLFGTPLPPLPSPAKTNKPSAPVVFVAVTEAPVIQKPVIAKNPPVSPQPIVQLSLPIPYSPETFLRSLQVFVQSLAESTRQWLVQVSPDGVY